MQTKPGLGSWRCPGVFREIHVQVCPDCGDELEFFPQDISLACPNCGIRVGRSSSSCLLHCPAKQSGCYRDMVRAELLRQSDGAAGYS